MLYRIVIAIVLLASFALWQGCGQSNFNDSEVNSAVTTADEETSTPKEWISKAKLLTPLNVAPSSGVVGSKIYVIGGGVQYGTSNKVQIYDTINNSWSYGTSSSSEYYHVYNNTAVVGTKI